MDKKEMRCASVTELRIKPPEDGKPPIIEGHAAVFDSLSQDLGFVFPFKERIARGAFKETIGRDDIRALFNHDVNYVLGRNRAGTLELKETPKGLKVRIHPPDTQWARDLAQSIARGDVTQMSFGFAAEAESWSNENGVDVRTLDRVRLFDVSPVTFPAYLDTDIAVRSAMDSYESHKKTKENEEHEAEQKRAEFSRLKKLFGGKNEN